MIEAEIRHLGDIVKATVKFAQFQVYQEMGKEISIKNAEIGKLQAKLNDLENKNKGNEKVLREVTQRYNETNAKLKANNVKYVDTINAILKLVGTFKKGTRKMLVDKIEMIIMEKCK